MGDLNIKLCRHNRIVSIDKTKMSKFRILNQWLVIWALILMHPVIETIREIYSLAASKIFSLALTLLSFKSICISLI